MADFTPTDLITLSKALEHYERHAEPSLLPPQRELMQTRATLLHQMNVASMAICERLTEGQEFPPAKDGQKSLYQLLTELEQSDDIKPRWERDDGGFFVADLIAFFSAENCIAAWYLRNHGVAHEVISEALYGHEPDFADHIESDETVLIGAYFRNLIAEKAMEYAQADPAWEKLIQDITERVRS